MTHTGHRTTARALGVAILLASAAHATTPADVCAVAKLKAASKKTVSKLACYGKASTTGLPVDDACLAKADQKFADAFAKAEAKGGCSVTGDAAQVEAHVDACVTKLVMDEPGNCAEEGESCEQRPCCLGFACLSVASALVCETTTTTTSTTTTTLPCGASIAPLCNGTCPPPQQCLPTGMFVTICLCQ